MLCRIHDRHTADRPGSNFSCHAGSCLIRHANQNKPISILYVQGSQSVSLVPTVDSTYTLTPGKVDPYTMHCLDRPRRIAGFTTTESHKFDTKIGK